METMSSWRLPIKNELAENKQPQSYQALPEELRLYYGRVQMRVYLINSISFIFVKVDLPPISWT